MRRSLAWRLLIWMVAIFSLTWGMLAWAIYQNARHEVEEVFDAQLVQYARIILSLTLHELEEENPKEISLAKDLAEELSGHKYENNVVFQVFRNEKMLFRADGAPHVPLGGAGKSLPNGRAEGFDERFVAGDVWRIFVLKQNDGVFQVHVGERQIIRDEVSGKITRQALWPLLTALPLLMLLIHLGVKRGLQPLKRLAAEVIQRSPLDLSPVGEAQAPEETLPLIRSLNALLQRLQRALEHERRFTADAAHELRTPLAAIKVHAQVALRAVDEDSHREALQGIVSGSNRAVHLVEQLLTLARLEEGRAELSMESVSLLRLTEAVLSEMALLAIQRQIELYLASEVNPQVLGNGPILAVLLRNLVDNGIRYTPHGGQVVVTILDEGQHISWIVEDSGPGIAMEQRAVVLERFRRGKEKDAHGCGIGLSIVQRIVQLHHATLELRDSSHGGLKVVVGFSRSLL